MFSAQKILVFLLLFFSLLVLAPNSYAQSNLQNPQQAEYSLISLLHAIGCLGMGTSPIGQPCLNSNPNEQSSGVLGIFTKGIALMFIYKPVSGVDYLANMSSNFGLAKPAYAQVGGTGAEVIRPIEKLWQLSRNIAYLVMAIILVVIGVMIMLRSKINPQTVVGIQQALPGVITALILITFSYFIAGFIIDLAFVFTQVFGVVVISSLSANSPSQAADLVRDLLNNNNVFGLFSHFLARGDLASAAGTLGDVITVIFQATPQTAAIITTLVAVGTGLAAGGGIVGLIVGGIAGATTAISPDTVAGALAVILLFVGLLQAIFRLFLGLINAYVTIVLNTIFGPFMILSSAIPGRGGATGEWLRTLAANVLIFPVVFGMFVLVAAILGFDTPWPWGGNPASGPVGTINQTLPLLGGFPEGFLRYILAYGIILASPGIPDLIRQRMNAQGPQQLGQAVTQATQAGTAATTGLITRGLRMLGG